jgi:DNA polymerase-1
MSHLIDENTPHDLGTRILQTFKDNYKEEFWSKYDNFEDASEEEQLEYAAKDGIYTYRLGIEDSKCINLGLYEHIRKLSLSLLDTELNGILVNEDLMKQTQVSMKRQIDEYLPKLREEFNEYCELWELKEWQTEIEERKSVKGKSRVQRPTFSFTSDSQLRELLYSKECGLGLEVTSRTKSKSPSTTYEAIEKLATSDSRLQTLLKYKELKTIYSIFVEGMLERVENGRIYPHFNVSGTTTGRISHSNPNMGNLPKDGVFRNFFIPSSGMVIIGADYTQLEVVIEANLTNDPNLLKIINKGVSKHDITAQGLGIDRNTAKTLNFALQYGAGVQKVAKIIGLPREASQEVFDRYWDLYSGVRSLKEMVRRQIEDFGKITNLAGRIRHFPETDNHWEREKQYRQGYNFLIQGVAAEACNRAFYRFHNTCKENNIGRGLFTVHDEIVAEVKVEYAQKAMENLVTIMENSTSDFGFEYPLKALAYGPLLTWSKE